MFNDEAALRAGAGIGGSDYVAANNVLTHHAGQSTVKGTFSATTSGGGGVISIESTAHGLTTGDKVAIRTRGQGVGEGTEYTCTVVDADNFTLDSSVWTHTFAGSWEQIETTTDKYYPGVRGWVIVKAVGGDVTFDDGCRIAGQQTGQAQLRAPAAPQEDEVITDDQFWIEGVLDRFIMKTGGGAARLVRG